MKKPSMSHAVRVGAFIVLFYVVCLVWPLIYPYSADVLTHHLLSLKLLFPGFLEYTAGSIVWGGILSFIYGFVGSMFFHAFHASYCVSKK